MTVKTPLCNYSGTIKELQSGDSVSIGYTAENVVNKATDFSTINNTLYGSLQAVETRIQYYISGVNPATSVQAATTSASNTSSFTYNNGAAGIGATLTGAVNTALTVDGYTFTAINQRLLVKNDTQSPSGAYNGIYYVTQVQTALLPLVLTRALDYNQPNDINNTGSIPVVNGTVNALTSWLLISSVTTVGTDPLTYTQFSANPSGYVPYTGATSDINLGSYNYATTGAHKSNVTTAEGTAFDFRLSGITGTNLGLAAASVIGVIAGSNSTSVDIEQKNTSTGANATVDHTLSMDTNTDYGGVGMTSKNYNGFSAYSAYCQYLYSQTSDIVFATAAAGKNIYFTTGGQSSSNWRGYFGDTGLTMLSPILNYNATSISAAGSTQGGATALTADQNVITTVASNTGVRLPTAIAGAMITVINQGANTLNLYPATGGNIDGGSTNAAVTIASLGFRTVMASSTTAWYTSSQNSSTTYSLKSGTAFVTGAGSGTTITTSATAKSYVRCNCSTNNTLMTNSSTTFDINSITGNVYLRYNGTATILATVTAVVTYAQTSNTIVPLIFALFTGSNTNSDGGAGTPLVTSQGAQGADYGSNTATATMVATVQLAQNTTITLQVANTLAAAKTLWITEAQINLSYVS